MSENIFIQLRDGITDAQRNEVFGLVRKMPQIKFVCDLSAINRDLLDKMLLPTRTKKAERLPNPSEGIKTGKTLKERLSG